MDTGWLSPVYVVRGEASVRVPDWPLVRRTPVMIDALAATAAVG